MTSPEVRDAVTAGGCGWVRVWGLGLKEAHGGAAGSNRVHDLVASYRAAGRARNHCPNAVTSPEVHNAATAGEVRVGLGFLVVRVEGEAMGRLAATVRTAALRPVGWLKSFG